MNRKSGTNACGSIETRVAAAHVVETVVIVAVMSCSPVRQKHSTLNPEKHATNLLASRILLWSPVSKLPIFFELSSAVSLYKLPFLCARTRGACLFRVAHGGLPVFFGVRWGLLIKFNIAGGCSDQNI